MNSNLEKWRKQIDKIDEKILILLAKRMNLSSKIGNYKKVQNLPPLDKQRWNQVLKSNLNKTKTLNLPEDFVKKLLNLIHKYSLKLQK